MLLEPGPELVSVKQYTRVARQLCPDLRKQRNLLVDSRLFSSALNAESTFNLAFIGKAHACRRCSNASCCC